MISYYEKMVKHLDLDCDAKDFLLEKGENAIKNYQQKIEQLIELYYENGCNYPEISEKAEEFSTLLGEDIFVVNFIFFACAAQKLEKIYEEKNIDKQIFYDTIKDLGYKVNECKQVKGVYGIFVPDWYKDIFLTKTFTLGRLQYQKCECHMFDDRGIYKYGDFTVQNGDTVYNIHIPSSGPLTEELRLDSYKKAYEFLEKRPDGKLVLMCASWLLYWRNEEILGPESNIVHFMKDFDLMLDYVAEGDSNMWRIFGYEYDGKPENLPRNTRVQRSVAQWYEKGGHLGAGVGVLILDENGKYNK